MTSPKLRKARAAGAWWRSLLLLGSVGVVSGGGRLWEPLAPLPAGNAGCACGVLHNRLVVAGGTEVTGGVRRPLDAVVVYDSAEDRWRQIGRLPRPFYYGAFAAHDGTLFIVGGDDGILTRSDIWAVDLSGAGKKFAELRRPVGYTSSVRMGGDCYILGGTRNVRDLSRLTAEFLRLNLTNGAIETLPDFPGGPVIQLSLAGARRQIYAFPGGVFNNTERTVAATRGAWRYALDSRHWATIASYPFSVRAVAACALDDSHIFLAGGSTIPSAPGGNTATAASYLYDVAADRYLSLPPLPFAAMLIGVQKVGSAVYLIGGEDRAKHRSNAVYRARIGDLIGAAKDGTPL